MHVTYSTHMIGCWDMKKGHIVRSCSPVLVDAVDGELEVGVLALDADVVPREVVEAEAARARNLRLARPEVDVHLKRRQGVSLNFINISGMKDVPLVS